MNEREAGVVFTNNTRFNPTVNGHLHLGHLFMALLNQTEARVSGGTFGVRFDDTQRYWNWACGAAKVDEYAAEMRYDLEYFGIKPDTWTFQSEEMTEVEHLLEREFHTILPPQPFTPAEAATVVGYPHIWYPYTHRMTAEKVVFDWLERCNVIIRGIDLLTEDCLYRYFVDKFTLPPVKLVYVPRLLFAGDVISKTSGGNKLRDYRMAKVDPQEVIDYLAYDCLKAGLAWRVENVKDQPVLSCWAGGMLHGVHN